MGGTELRVLAVHSGKLYAGNSYWEDRPRRKGCKAHKSSFSTDRTLVGA
jgi:hypothetical protein